LNPGQRTDTLRPHGNIRRKESRDYTKAESGSTKGGNHPQASSSCRKGSNHTEATCGRAQGGHHEETASCSRESTRHPASPFDFSGIRHPEASRRTAAD
jgi:hypothetical protein